MHIFRVYPTQSYYLIAYNYTHINVNAVENYHTISWLVEISPQMTKPAETHKQLVLLAAGPNGWQQSLIISNRGVLQVNGISTCLLLAIVSQHTLHASCLSCVSSDTHSYQKPHQQMELLQYSKMVNAVNLQSVFCTLVT